MADHPITLGASDLTVSVANEDTITMTNGGTQKIKVTSPQGLDPQGSNDLDAAASLVYTVDVTSGTHRVQFTWNEVGAHGQRTGTIDVS